MEKFIKILLLFYILCFFSVDSFAEKIFFAEGNKDKKEIALTFDDGPGRNTLKILNILKEKNVKATFFLQGASIIKNPHLVKQIYDSGHEIGNHTFNHVNFYKDPNKTAEDYKNLKEKIEEELIKNQDMIEDIIGIKTKLVRYPYGYMRQPAIDVARENGYKVINWSFGTDWKHFPSYEYLLGMYLEQAKPGAIFLMHDLLNNSLLVEMLPQLIDLLKFVGYDFVTVSELLNFD